MKHKLLKGLIVGVLSTVLGFYFYDSVEVEIFNLSPQSLTLVFVVLLTIITSIPGFRDYKSIWVKEVGMLFAYSIIFAIVSFLLLFVFELSQHNLSF